jgi:hypothetical protein
MKPPFPCVSWVSKMLYICFLTSLTFSDSKSSIFSIHPLSFQPSFFIASWIPSMHIVTGTYENRRHLKGSAHLKSRAVVIQSASAACCTLSDCAPPAFVCAGHFNSRCSVVLRDGHIHPGTCLGHLSPAIC